MDVLVRNVSPMIVKKLDDKARKKGISREEFLREQLEVIAHIDLLIEYREKVNNSLGNVADNLKTTFDKLDSMEEKYERLLYLLSYVTDINLHDMDQFIEEQINGRNL